MLRLVFAVICTLPLLEAGASAQSATTVRQTCDGLLKPAYENVADYKKDNLTMDCACMTGFLTGRYGDEDAELLMRLFSVFSTESEQQIRDIAQKVGATRMRALTAKIGNFQTVGREMDQACPPVKKL